MTAIVDPSPDAPPAKRRGGGPRTPEGKARSRENALKHSLRAEAGLEGAAGALKEKIRMHELAKYVGKSQVEQAEAGVKVAHSNLTRAEVDLQKAGLDLERAKSLFEKQFIAAKDLDDARTNYESARDR